MVEIRHARPEDAGEIELVRASATAALRRIYRPNAKALENKASISRDLERLVALVDGRVVGTTQIYVDGECLRIVGLGVLEEHRKCGVARELTGFLLGLAAARGLKGIGARTIRETGNVSIFESLGFHVVSEVKDEYSESDLYSELRDVDLFRPATAL